MKKCCFLFILTLLLIPTICVNALSFNEKVLNFGGNGDDTFHAITKTSDGGYVVVGWTTSSNINGFSYKGTEDALIIKYDKNDKIVWARDYGGSSDDRFYEVIETSDGYIATGTVVSTDIGGVYSNGYIDATAVKYDKSGNIVWQKNYGGYNYDYFYGMTATSDGGFIGIGVSASTDTFSISGMFDAIIVKCDGNGNILWKNSYGGDNLDFFYGIEETSDGGYLVVGSTYSSYVEGISNNGGVDAIIVKYNKSGSREWAKHYGGNGDDTFFEVKETNDGGFIVGGYSSSTNIDGLKNNGNYDGLIVKYDKNRNIEWQTNYGTNAFEEITLLTLTDDGYLVGGGRYTYTNSNNEETNSGDGFIVKYDKNGNIQLEKNYKGDTNDFLGISKVDDNNFLIVGRGAIPFEGVKYNSDTDGIVLKLRIEDDKKLDSGNDKIIPTQNIKNPNTGLTSFYILSSILIIVSLVSLVLVRKKKSH